jgi:hypothetical protein
MNHKKFRCSIPFGLQERVVYVFSDPDEYLRKAKKSYNRPDLIPVPPNFFGQAFGMFVYLKDPFDMVTVVHEFIHVIDGAMQEMEITNDTEVRAYLMNGLLSRYIAKANIRITKQIMHK